MWTQKPNLIERKEYKVMDGQKFIHVAVYQDNKFINKVTKAEIKNVVWIWE